MDKVADKLQAALDAQVGRRNLHSVVAVVQSCDRRIDFAGAAGIADPGTGAAMTPDTPYYWPRPLPEFIGHSGTTGSFAFTCPSRSIYLAGTIDQIGPSRPFFLMITLARAVG